MSLPTHLSSFFEKNPFLLSAGSINMGEQITDKDLLGEKAEMSHEEVAQLAELTEEEKVIEKKLRRRLDCTIMPLVILVYLMNYIDR